MFGDPRVDSFVDPMDSVLYCVVWLCPCDGMLLEYAHDEGCEDTTIKTRLHVSSAIIL